MNREQALQRAIELKEHSQEFESVSFIDDDTEFFEYVIKELERTAPEVPVQEQYISTCSSCGYFNEIKLTPSFNPNYCMNCGSKTIYFQSNQGN